MNVEILAGQTVFARWKDGYYYPAVIEKILENDTAKVSFLDGYSGTVSQAHFVQLQDALETMQLQGNWKNFGFFFKGALDSQESMLMYYDDGDIEQIELSQLRGERPGEPVATKQAAKIAACVLALGAVVLIAHKVRKRRG